MSVKTIIPAKAPYMPYVYVTVSTSRHPAYDHTSYNLHVRLPWPRWTLEAGIHIKNGPHFKGFDIRTEKNRWLHPDEVGTAKQPIGWKRKTPTPYFTPKQEEKFGLRPKKEDS